MFNKMFNKMSMCRVDLQLIYSNRHSLSCSQLIKCSKRTDKASPETNLFVVIPVSCNNNNATVRIIPSLGFVLPCVILEQLLSFPERTGRRNGSDATKRGASGRINSPLHMFPIFAVPVLRRRPCWECRGSTAWPPRRLLRTNIAVFTLKGENL